MLGGDSSPLAEGGQLARLERSLVQGKRPYTPGTLRSLKYVTIRASCESESLVDQQIPESQDQTWERKSAL